MWMKMMMIQLMKMIPISWLVYSLIFVFNFCLIFCFYFCKVLEFSVFVVCVKFPQGELNDLTGENEDDDEPSEDSHVVEKPSISTSNLLSILEERLKMYQTAEANAKSAGETSRARRFVSIFCGTFWSFCVEIYYLYFSLSNTMYIVYVYEPCRFTRGSKTILDQMKSVRNGGTVKEEDIPPPVATRAGGGAPQPAQLSAADISEPGTIADMHLLKLA